MDNFIPALSIILQIYPYTSLVLYAVITYAAGRICNFTNHQMKHLKDQNEELSQLEYNNHLEKWNMRQILVNQIVASTNDCFGFILLLSTYYLFITWVNFTFFIFTEIMDSFFISKIMFYFYVMLNYIIALSLICFPADYLASEVNVIL